MVKVVIGNIFESRAQTLTNTVNCVGVMGKGVALEFKKHFPDMFQDYARRCERHEVKLGEPYLYKRVTPPWILNFPTKDHWRSVARLEDIIRGLKFLEQRYREWGISSLAVPPLGCGQGQLDWRVVGPALYRELKKEFNVFYDDKGAVGRRYRRQDEAGTPYCITIDGQTLQDNTVTIRDRDTTQQRRIPLTGVAAELKRCLQPTT